MLIHLRRYAPAKKRDQVARVEVLSSHEVTYLGHRYDLKRGVKGEKFAGWLPTRQGRYFTWDDTTLVVHHPDGKQVRLEGTNGFNLALVSATERHLLLALDARQPWTIFNTDTGEKGQVDGQKPTVMFARGPALYSHAVVGGVWLNEGARLTRIDLDARKVAQEIVAPEGSKFIGGTLAEDGRIAVLQRPLSAGLERTEDSIVIFDAAGNRIAERALTPNGSIFLGKDLLISDDTGSRFLLLSEDLETKQKFRASSLVRTASFVCSRWARRAGSSLAVLVNGTTTATHRSRRQKPQLRLWRRR